MAVCVALLWLLRASSIFARLFFLLFSLQTIHFTFVRAPLAIYDLPAMFRAIWSHDVHDMATATTMNILPFGRLTKDVLTAYQSPSMAADILAGIPLHRVDNFYTKAKKQQMRLEALEEEKARLGDSDELSVQEERQRLR